MYKKSHFQRGLIRSNSRKVVIPNNTKSVSLSDREMSIVTHHKNLFISSHCSIPALKWNRSSWAHLNRYFWNQLSGHRGRNLQCLSPSSKSISFWLCNLVIFLDKSYTQQKDISSSKLYVLVPCHSLEVGNGDRVSVPWIIRHVTPVLCIVADQIKENPTTTDTVVRPVYTKDK